MERPKIYFAGSIRGGRDDAALYREIIARCNAVGEVLTEHVGDLSKSSLEGTAGSDAAIYEDDTRKLVDADLVIAEATCPSLGVGYELAFAEAHGVPCHVFYDKSRAYLSAMIQGDPYFHVIPYETKEALFAALACVLGGAS